MKTPIKNPVVALVLLSTLNLLPPTARAQDTAFTYQGQLSNGGSPANGSYDLLFTLFNANSNGVIITGPITNSATAVTNGLFTTTIDFGGGVFTGSNYSLQVAIRTNGNGAFAALSPLQPILPTPYAIYSINAGNAATATTAISAGIAGSANSVSALNIVGKIQATQLPAGVLAFLNANQSFAGVNVFNSNVVVGTPPPYWEDEFTVHPAANRGLGVVAANGGGGSVTSGMTIESVNDTATANQPLEFRGNPCVFTTGNTGFGTTTPFRFFQVHPTANENLGIFQGGLTSGMTIENVNDANTANEPLEFRGSPNVFETGYVGIGLTAPTSALDVNGTITMTGNLDMPATTASPDIIYSGNSLLLDCDNNGNFFGGVGAGNLTLSGSSNTGIGDGALAAVTTGGPNTAVGSAALRSSTSGYNNTAFGDSALVSNTNGFENEANGHVALYHNTSGGNNTANGSGALYNNTSGSFNTANGYHVLFSNTTGNNNAANGFQALNNDTTGSNNIAEGYEAGYNVTAGSSNIEIGNVGTASDNNAIYIGTQGIQTNTSIAGIYGSTVASGVPVYVTSSGQLGTLTSSARFKKDIKSMNKASDVLLSLHPVMFRYKSEIDPQGIPQFGLIAEEVDKVDPDLVAHDDTGKPYTVRYEAVNAMLLNEFLKQHHEVEEQNTEIENLKQSVAELKQLVQTLADKK